MKQRPTKTLFCRLMAAASAGMMLAIGTTNILAADKTWNGAGDGTSMSSSGNWVGGVAPVASDSLFFGTAGGASVNNDFAAGISYSGITFPGGAGAFTFTGASLAIGAGLGITNNSSTAQTFSLQVGTGTTPYVVYTGGGGGDITMGNNYKAAVNKYGAGTLTFGGSTDNNAEGATINEGTLVLGKASSGSIHAIGSAPLGVTVNTNGTLRLAGTGGDQIYSRSGLYVDGKLQVQASENLLALWGTNGTGIVENGLAGTTNVLAFVNYNNQRGGYNGIIRDGAAGVLEIDVTGGGSPGIVQQFDGTNTYTGPTKIYTTSSGNSRLIMNGVHTGGGDYFVYGNTASQNAYLHGKGVISASSVNIWTNGYLSPGGAVASTGSGSASSAFSDNTAILTLSNAVVNFSTNATLEIQANGSTAGTGYDQLDIEGSGSLSNNSANLKLSFGYTPAVGDKFTIVKVGGTSSASNVGTFATLNGVVTDLSQGAIFVDSGTGKSLQISYRAEGSTFDAGAGNGNDIMLQVVTPVGGRNLVWRGNGADNNWDITTTADWSTNGPSLTTFTNGDFVTFDDSGSNNIPLNLVGGLSPSTVLVNSTNSYVFGGAGYFTNTVVLTKTNTGTLSIVTDNGNVGSTIIQRGTLQVGTNGVTGTLSGTVIVNPGGTLAYNHSDDKVISTAAFSGTGSFVHNGSGQLTVTADLSSAFTGNTTNSGAMLQFGDGTGNAGQIGGTVYVPATNIVHYYLGATAGATANILNALGGNGTVNYESPGNGTLAIATTAVSSNFTGTANLAIGLRVHASDHNQGYPFGNGSTVNVPSFSQAWLDRNDTGTYNNTFNIAGTGWLGATPQTGALSIFGCTLNGAINLQANARIGGTISGGTILCPISGAYQLEVWGNAGSYVLSMGPTNGIHSYTSTLITSGTVRALNSNAISTGPLIMDIAADLRLNGNNLAVSNLSSINSGQVTGTGATIQNIGSNPATLTVGADDTSSQFDGLFFNGGTGALGLTKVGAGIFTVTAASTNTGAVTVGGGTLALNGSGSFANAATLAVATGATLDVSTRSDGTLTLSAGQILKHSGSTVGAITIAGNLNMGSGTLLLALNRTNTPATNDSLAVSGTLTAGGTLTVTNLGSALQVGNSFTLFSAGVSGFAYNLQTNDYVNNVKYTWNNTVSADGKITVASVTPLVNTNAPQIQSSVSGNTLHLAWPTNAGWTLLTNSAGLTATNQWFPYPNSANLTNVDVSLDPAKTNVFFRMVYPYP